MASRPRNLEMALGVGIAAVLAVVFFLNGGGGPARDSAGASATTAAAAPSGSGTRSGVVPYSQLPAQAQQTVQRIRDGGPFPYRHDGAVFENREGHLPPEPHGYYHEYTVPTPGVPDRGARRIVAGQDAELYYTDDHYRSFHRIEGTR